MNEEQTSNTSNNTPVNPDRQTNPPKVMPSQESIRTYESDIAKALAQRKTTVANIAIAENEKREQKQEQIQIKKDDGIENETRKKHTKQFFMLFLSVVLIGGGAIGAYYLYLKSPLSSPPAIQQSMAIPSIIPSDKQIYFFVDSLSNEKLISQIYSQFNKKLLENGEILEFILQEKKMEGEEEISSPITGSSFIQKIQINMPDILVRSLTDRWMLGEYAEENGIKTTFIALTTNFFQNAFAGMLNWENSMPDDLALLLNFEQKARAYEMIPIPVSISNSTSSLIATSSANKDNTSSKEPAIPSISSYFNIRGVFVDRQIRNRDVREFKNNRGEILFLYSFINKETLILTTTESAFIAIIDRIEKQTYVR